MQDYDAIAAEAEKRAFTFPYAGRTWRIRRQEDIDWRLLKRSITGDVEAVDAIFEHGMGPDQYAAWGDVDQMKSVVSAIFQDYMEFCGIDPGKSENSTGSSESTETPSRPASKRPTRSTSRTSSPARSRRGASSSS